MRTNPSKLATRSVLYALRGRLWTRQSGACPICRERLTGKPVAIDYDHRNGTVRGLLCFGCNNLVGLVEAQKHVVRNAHLVEAALRYVRI